ncbi:MAG: septum formation initiator family protein [Prevotellaceae bacterium]|nr:septum formation initiator family protein [Prevotellaceae bacterium]
MTSGKNILRFLKKGINKYTLTLLGFGVWLVFFDPNSLVQRLKITRQNASITKEINHFRRTVEASLEQLSDLSNDEMLEKYAREHYLMKKTDEEIFLIR